MVWEKRKTVFTIRRNLLNRLFVFITIACILNACKLCFDDSDYTPIAILTSSKTSISIEESISLDLVGTDENGIDDIIEYELWLDRNNNTECDNDESLLKQSTPINDYIWIPQIAETITIIGQCTDSIGLKGKTSLVITIYESKLPYVNISDVDLVEGKTSLVDLPDPIDEDTFGEIPYIDAEVIEGNLEITLNGNRISLVAGTISNETPFKVRMKFGSARGGINTTELKGVIKNLFGISGFLQDNESHTNQIGEIRLYDSYGKILATTLTSNELVKENFSILCGVPASIVILKGKYNNSYVRTILYDGTKDYSSQKIRAVPYPSFGTSPIEDFKYFANQINIALFSDSYGHESGLLKWDLNEFKGIEIFRNNPSDTSSYFTIEQQLIIADQVKKEVPKFINGRILEVQIDNEISQSHVGEDGWICVMPKFSLEDMFGNGIAGSCNTNFNLRNTGLISIANIKLEPSYVLENNPVVLHEFGHAFIAPIGHASDEYAAYTIMPNSHLQLYYPGIADEKIGKIIYEESYLPRDKLDDIFGNDWNN